MTDEQIKQAAIQRGCIEGTAEYYGFIEGAQYYRAQLRNPWISVEERMPEKDEFVFTLGHKNSIDRYGDYAISQYLGNNRWWIKDGDYSIEFTGCVTNWMPIPELKKG